MPRCFTGTDGYYEIYNKTSIIHQKVDESRTFCRYKIYNSYKDVPNSQDRWRIEQIIVGNVLNKDFGRYNNKVNWKELILPNIFGLIVI